jgi:dTDP-4-dehydro-6-deoxy-alpha-D-glucopyranose 2,3-dehydratase
MNHKTINENQFLNSALTEENPLITTSKVMEWLKNRNEAINVEVTKIPFEQLDHWFLDKTNGMLKHSSGKFFTIEGINVKTNWGAEKEWEQPIINQPEIGYLGIITKEINGILYFLLQAKVEPGNVNNVQLSPTLQATKSNYTQVHQGNKPRYLEYFQNATRDEIILDQLQSEQGARFLKKRNRNIIIKIDGDINVHEDFIWLTLGQIKKLIQKDNLVNMDTRTVISGISFEHSISLEQKLNDFELGMLQSANDKNNSKYNFDDIIKWITDLKCKYELTLESKSIFNIKNWHVTPYDIRHEENKYFRVIAAQVAISNREVKTWSQPLVEPLQEGIIAFVVKKINGIYHFLVQAKLESGNFDIIEMAPTVQCITGSYDNKSSLPFLDFVLNAKDEQIKFNTLQSEEGGRFYREQNKSMIIEADESFPYKIPENYIWLTLNQINYFLKFNNYLNIQARSLISAVKFI